MNTNLENAKAQMRKGVLELCILSIIAEREAYPSDILEKLKASDLLVVEGTLYPLLTRLKDGGYLEYRWVESDIAPANIGEQKKGGGPPRKYYSLTGSGRTVLADMHTAWNELVESVGKITGLTSIHSDVQNVAPINPDTLNQAAMDLNTVDSDIINPDTINQNEIV